MRKAQHAVASRELLIQACATTQSTSTGGIPTHITHRTSTRNTSQRQKHDVVAASSGSNMVHIAPGKREVRVAQLAAVNHTRSRHHIQSHRPPSDISRHPHLLHTTPHHTPPHDIRHPKQNVVAYRGTSQLSQTRNRLIPPTTATHAITTATITTQMNQSLPPNATPKHWQATHQPCHARRVSRLHLRVTTPLLCRLPTTPQPHQHHSCLPPHTTPVMPCQCRSTSRTSAARLAACQSTAPNANT